MRSYEFIVVIFSHQAESFDSKSGTDLFDIILPKVCYISPFFTFYLCDL